MKKTYTGVETFYLLLIVNRTSLTGEIQEFVSGKLFYGLVRL